NEASWALRKSSLPGDACARQVTFQPNSSRGDPANNTRQRLCELMCSSFQFLMRDARANAASESEISSGELGREGLWREIHPAQQGHVTWIGAQTVEERVGFDQNDE